jgi:alkylated DNA repair dioxygenase AlkB
MRMNSTKKHASAVDCGTDDLFGEPELPTGFRYLPNIISSAEEKNLVHRFERLALKSFEFHGHLGNRRIYTFGHKYVFAGQEPRSDASIPDYLRPLTDIASQISGMPADEFEQVMVTEYAPGAGIGWHRDRPSYEHIVAVSFLAPCTLRLRRKLDKSWERRSAQIEPRSAYLLHGSVRDDWQHSIAPMDLLRYSVTLRTFRPGRGSKN